MEKKNVIFLSVIAVATLLTAVIGTTFAFFTATANNEAAKEVSMTTATMGVTFAQDSAIKFENIVPGATEQTIKFSVQNTGTGTAPTYFTLGWVNVTALAGQKAGDAVYTLSRCEDSTCAKTTDLETNTDLPAAAGTIAGAKKEVVAVGATNWYQLTVKFVDTGVNQDYLQGKSFAGTINVTAAATTATGIGQ